MIQTSNTNNTSDTLTSSDNTITSDNTTTLASEPPYPLFSLIYCNNPHMYSLITLSLITSQGILFIGTPSTCPNLSHIPYIITPW